MGGLAARYPAAAATAAAAAYIQTELKALSIALSHKRLRKCRQREEREARRGVSRDHTIFAVAAPCPNYMWLGLMAVFGKAKARVWCACLSMPCAVRRERGAKTQAFLACRRLRFEERERRDRSERQL